MRVCRWRIRCAIIVCLVVLSCVAALGTAIVSAASTHPLQGPDYTVRVVLFHKPECPDCDEVIEELLPEVQLKYGEGVQIAMIDISTVHGAELFESAAVRYDLLRSGMSRPDVPALIIGSSTLVGVDEARKQIPDLVSQYLLDGGTAWPALPGIEEIVSYVDPSPGAIMTSDKVVRTVLFYSPNCPHCHVVRTETLPKLRSTYGKRLVVAEIDTTSSEGRAVWQAVVTLYNPPIVGVPTLLVGEHILIGSVDIPQSLPGIIDAYLDAGGVGWPDVPGLEAAVTGLEPAPSSGFLADMVTRFRGDLAGNILSVLVLLGLVAGLVAVIKPSPWQTAWSERVGLWVLLPLLLGFGISLYLAHVETSGVDAVCGPIGDCNTVQQSRFALLFGFLPVAVLGVIGYAAILLTYSLWLLTQAPFRLYLPGAIFVMAFFGLSFATYLTFLEPFVIGATCMWCLTQSVCMLVVVLLTAGPGWASLQALGIQIGLVEKPTRQSK